LKSFLPYLKRAKPLFDEEFSGQAKDIKALCDSIKKSGYSYQCKSPDNTVDILNEILTFPDLYKQLSKANPGLIISEDMKILAKLVEKMSASNEDRERFNRLLLETIYPEETPKCERITDEDYKFLSRLRFLFHFSYEELKAKKTELTGRDADLIVAHIGDPKWRLVIKNMFLKEPVICQICGDLFLSNKGSNKETCSKHTAVEVQRYRRSLKPAKKRGGPRPGAGRKPKR